MPREFGVILNNVRSCENVGSILRTASFFGFEKVWFVGVTPYPTLPGDHRLPHVREKLNKKIKKVSLGSEIYLSMSYAPNLKSLVGKLKSNGWSVVGLEQHPYSTALAEFADRSDKLAVVLGTETVGLSSNELDLMDRVIEIPGSGKKESLNVGVAFGVAASSLRSN